MPPRPKPSSTSKRGKWLTLIIAGIILQTVIIVTFVMVFLRITNPKVRFRSLTVEKLTVNSKNSASFSIRLNGEVTVKNTNFGYYKFPNSTISVNYRGNAVGSAVLPGGRVKGRSTKKLNVTVAGDSKNDRLLSGDLNSGKITLTSNATLAGKLHLFNLIKRKKTATMNCTMDVNTKTSAVENLYCK